MGYLQTKTKNITYTPTILREGTGTNKTGFIEAGAFSVSIANVGNHDDAKVNGITLKKTETLSFNAGEANFLGRLEWETGTSELLMIILRK
jgi:hypothetical protein